MSQANIICIEKSVPNVTEQKSRETKAQRKEADRKAEAMAKEAKQEQKAMVKATRAAARRVEANRKAQMKKLNSATKAQAKNNMVDASVFDVDMRWNYRKLTDEENECVTKNERVSTLVELLEAVVAFAGLICIANFFTFRLAEMFSLSWIAYVPLGILGIANVLTVIRRHDQIEDAIKAGCEVSEAVVVNKSVLLAGKHSKNASDSTVYCMSAYGNNKFFYPVRTNVLDLMNFKRKSGAIILWTEGRNHQDKGYATRIRL